MKLTINIPDQISWTSKGIEATLDVTKIKGDVESLVAEAAVQGFRKAGVDAAASAKAYAEQNEMDEAEAREALMAKRIATWLKGEWGATRSDSLTEVDREMISMVRAAVKASDSAAYAAMKEPERIAACKADIAKMSDKERTSTAKMAEKRVELKRKQAEELAALELAV